MRGLMVIMLLGVASESYSMYYSYKRYISPYLPSTQSMQKSVPLLLGAAVGGSLGAYKAYLDSKKDPVLGLLGLSTQVLQATMGAALGGLYLAVRIEKRFKNDIEYATQLIEDQGIKQLPGPNIETAWGEIKQLPAQDILISLLNEDMYVKIPLSVTRDVVTDYVNKFLKGEVAENQIVAFNRAIIDCLKDEACCSLNSSGKRFFLRRFFNIYADPEKAAENTAVIDSFYSDALDNLNVDPNREPLSNDKIDDVIHYLDQNNQFNTQGLFGGSGRFIKRAYK